MCRYSGDSPLILDFYRDKLTETAIYYLGVFIIMTTGVLLEKVLIPVLYAAASEVVVIPDLDDR